MRLFCYIIATIFTFTSPTLADKNADSVKQGVAGVEAMPAKQARKVLFFSQTNGYKHKSIPVGLESFALLGKETGAYEAVVSNDLASFLPENIKQYDAICFLNTTGEVFSPSKRDARKLSEDDKRDWEKREKVLKKSLLEHIESGKGFIGIHSATDTFHKWSDYGKMIGGVFDSHPWNSKTEVSVKPVKKDHKIIAYLKGENLEFKEEIYQFKSDKITGNAEILLKLDPHKNSFEKARRNSNNIPVAWTKSHGKGRVFYSSLGHNNQMFTDPKILQHYLNGIQWVLGDFEE